MKTVALIAAGLALTMSAAACSTPEPARGDAAAPIPVVVTTTAAQDLSESFETGGVVRARVVATIVGKIMAEVQSVDVVPGQAVRAGQTLVRLDARDLEAGQIRAAAGEAAARHGLAGAEAERQAADAGLKLARVTFQRFTDLRARNSATQYELDEATTALRAAESRFTGADARVAEAKSGLDAATAASRAASIGLSYATLQAPFAGVVTEKRVEPGNMASPGQPLLTIEDTRAFRLEVRLDESRAAYVQLGAEITVRLDSPTSEGAGNATAITGRVAEVSRMLDPGSHDFLVKIDLPQRATGLRSGMFGRAALRGPAHRGIEVPSSALVRRGQMAYVYVVDASRKANLRMVNAADESGERVEIRAGLVPGEQVVVSPSAGLVDGSPVTPTAALTPPPTPTPQPAPSTAGRPEARR
ncbi:MAG: efflux RND transporter periplasmic adaptor subunit [Acidobacteria bacterium]|nr:efflux RND transporter periplasmic adaptor subunit [Acidobacteriota bacterium]